MDYYRLLYDADTPIKTWKLGNVISKNNNSVWDYISVKNTIKDKELTITIRKKGVPTDFSMADFEVLVVNEKVKNLLSENEVQFIPTTIQSLSGIEQHYLIYIKNECDCIDEENSTFDKFQVNDPIRPDKAGQYKTIYNMVVKPEGTQNLNIFRVKGYNVAVIISEVLKQKLEELNVTGVTYKKLAG